MRTSRHFPQTSAGLRSCYLKRHSARDYAQAGMANGGTTTSAQPAAAMARKSTNEHDAKATRRIGRARERRRGGKKKNKKQQRKRNGGQDNPTAVASITDERGTNSNSNSITPVAEQQKGVEATNVRGPAIRKKISHEVKLKLKTPEAGTETAVTAELETSLLDICEPHGNPKKRKRGAESTGDTPVNARAPPPTAVPPTAVTAPISPARRRRSARINPPPTTSSHFRAPVPPLPSPSVRRRSTRILKKTATSSPHFAPPTPASPTKKRPPAGTSIITPPPLTAPTFGLIQERLVAESTTIEQLQYRILVAAIFLNKTRGKAALPLLCQFLHDYPTPADLTRSSTHALAAFLQPLGLQRTRARRLVEFARVWGVAPPRVGVRWARARGRLRDTAPLAVSGLPVAEGDGEGGCEVAHLPGVGPYARDSWRIFCRDRMRVGLAGCVERGGEEWRRVVPADKELRAYLRWMWEKEGEGVAAGV